MSDIEDLLKQLVKGQVRDLVAGPNTEELEASHIHGRPLSFTLARQQKASPESFNMDGLITVMIEPIKVVYGKDRRNVFNGFIVDEKGNRRPGDTVVSVVYKFGFIPFDETELGHRCGTIAMTAQ